MKNHCRSVWSVLAVAVLFAAGSVAFAVNAAFASPGFAAPSTAAPTVIYTDILSGPNSGGENNQGIYLSIFGKNFGTSGLGSTTRVFVNNAEVASYRYLGASRGRTDIQQITVQPGALGGSAPPGVALPIKVVVNGVASNTDQTFTLNPGRIFFVDNVKGNDATGVPNDISHPFRTVQKTAYNSQQGCPIYGSLSDVAAEGVWGAVRQGDFIVMRGTGTPWTDNGLNYAFLRTQDKSGSAPKGRRGTGPISVMGYPGEDVFIDMVYDPQNFGGGITSADSARQQYGCGAWISISNLRIESGRQEGVITTESGSLNKRGSHWRVVNNELTAATAVNDIDAKGAGVAGNGSGEVYLGNYIHDIYCGPDDGSSPLQNHGFYFDAAGDYEVAYNRLYRIRGGNGLSLYATGSNGPAYVGNVNFHHNLIQNTGKHGLNVADGSQGNIRLWNNVVYDTDQSGIRFNTENPTDIRVFNNTFYNTDTTSNTNVAAISNDAGFAAATAINVENNIFYPHSGTAYDGGSSGGITYKNAIVTNNLWYGGVSGAYFSPQQIDSKPVTANPQFVTPGVNFQLQASSGAIDAGSSQVSPLVINDYDVTTARPQGAGYDIGAYEY